MSSNPGFEQVRAMKETIVSRAHLSLIFAVFLAPGAATAQQQIPTGGRIPDRRGFNNSVNDPKLTDPVEEVVRRVAGNVYVIAGAGGNIVVQAGPDGLFLVDDNFAVFYSRIVAALRQISDKPVRMIVNTHWHPDHNENNANFAQQGALVFAHPNTRAALMRLKLSAPEGLPVVTSSQPMTFHFNGEEISYIPLKPSHTNGDVAVYFHGSDVFAFGDVFTTDYPAIGIPEGGTIENFVDNYNLALQMTTPNTVFVPGHAQLSKQSDVIAVRDAITIIHARFLDMVKKGMTLEQIREARPSKEYDARFATENFAPNEMQNSGRWYEQMFEEAKAHLSQH
jgi:glyoxylase-like metal-dependent hydrolase (beta-lactamase superfamily II)